MKADALREEKRKEVFAALVNLQDQNWSIEQSRKSVADLFSIDTEDVRIIEREGLTKLWPPLSDFQSHGETPVD
jgi:hypothetical protein